MKNFISSIYIKPNPVSDERICVGLFVGSEDKALFAWSENKLKIITRLSSEDVYTFLNKSFVNLNNDISKKIGDNSQKEIFISHSYTSNYFHYLNKYNKGLIEFKEPKIISKPVNEKDFEQLFKLYVGETLTRKIESTPKETLHKQIKKHLDKPVFKDKTDRFYEVPETVIKTIYRPYKIDFISCNGSIFAGNSVDFTATPNTVESKLYEYRVLIEGLALFAKKKKMDAKPHFIVYFNEPVESEQKKIFDNAFKDKTKPYLLKEVDDIEKAAKLLERGHYKKFSAVI